MTEFLKEYKTQILDIAAFVTLPFLVFLISLAFVYISGRMLKLVKSDVGKNIIALITMTAAYVYYFGFYKCDLIIHERIWLSVVYASISIIIYVLIGFKLYDRTQTKLDEKLPTKRTTLKRS